MLPESLTKIIESTDYVDYDCRVRNIDCSTEPLTAQFSVNDTESSDKIIIEMSVVGKTDFFIISNDNTSFSHLELDHPLLWRFSDIQRDLYIKGQTKLIKELGFDLCAIHQSLFGGYIPFDLNILNVLSNGHGLFQKGPQTLLKMYADKLNEFGIETSIIGNSQLDKTLKPLKILFLGGSYFIGREFKFKVLD